MQWFGLETDVMERREADEALREADRRKNEFLATLAHELRNPLAPIRNAVQILNYRGPDDPILQEARDMIDRQVQHLVRLIDDLMDVSRITRGKLQLRKQRVSIASIVDQAVESSSPLIEGPGHMLHVSMAGEPVYLNADPVRLAQVFSNLLNNAAKYTEPGGDIFLTVRTDGSDVVVSVRDTGIGIPAEHLPRLFEMFSQVEPALERTQGGLGIGLSLVRGLVDMHGGEVEALSKGPGLGSEFIVRLPRLERLEEVVAEPPHRDYKIEPVGCRIVVADDNRDAVQSLAMMFRLMGCEVEIAYDGQEALEAVERFGPDLVLLDIGMPKLNGYETARLMRKQPWGQDLMLVALTGWGQEEDRQRSREAQFDHHMVKPLDQQSLAGLLRTVQERRNRPNSSGSP